MLGDDCVTAERMAKHLFEWCHARWPEVTAVRVSETPEDMGGVPAVSDESPLRVSEIFGPTIQGEGALIGVPTVFVRTWRLRFPLRRGATACTPWKAPIARAGSR